MTRTPAEMRTTRMGPLARLPAFFALEAKARRRRRRQRRRDVEGRTSLGRRRAGRRFHPSAGGGHARARRRAVAGAVIVHERAWQPADFAGAAIAVGDCADDDEAGAICRRGAGGRRAGQCHRPSGVLRFLLRRHRQPLAAGHRHFDRRRRAGVRPGDPRQDRGADPERLRPLGRRRAGLASARSSAGVAVPRPPEFLGEIRRPRGRRARTRAERGRPRRVAGAGRRAAEPARWFWSAPAPAIRNC